MKWIFILIICYSTVVFSKNKHWCNELDTFEYYNETHSLVQCGLYDQVAHECVSINPCDDGDICTDDTIVLIPYETTERCSHCYQIDFIAVICIHLPSGMYCLSSIFFFLSYTYYSSLFFLKKSVMYL